MTMHPDPHIRIGQLLKEAQATLDANPDNAASKRRVDHLTNLATARRLMRKSEIMLGDAKARRSAYPGGVIPDLEEIRALAEMLVRGLEK